MAYFERSVETKANKYMENQRALFILGARQVGKTTLLKRLIQSVGEQNCVYFDLENPEHLSGLSGTVNDSLAYIRHVQPRNKGRIFVFIDEIQYFSDFSKTVKYIVDHHSHEYKLVMTGSSSLLIKQSFSESLVGRKDILELYPLSFSEYCRFKGEEALAQLICAMSVDKYSTLPISPEKLRRMMGEYIIYGSYPQVVLSDNRVEKIELLRDIVNSYILKDVKHLFRIEKIDHFNNLIRYLAINIGKELNIQAVSKTVGLYWDTVQKHLQALTESYIIAQMKPFHRNINSEIRKMPKIYFIDTGVRNAILNNFNVLELQSDRGEQFENFVHQQLFFQKDILTEIRFWKTRSGQEIDFVVLSENSINAYEVKYGHSNQNHFLAFQKAYPRAICSFIRFNNSGTL